jgi:hypothetical protein
MLVGACITPDRDPTALVTPEGADATVLFPRGVCDPPDSETDSPGEVECVGVGGFDEIEVSRGGTITIELDGSWEFEPAEGVEMVRTGEYVWVLGPFDQTQPVSLRSAGAGGRFAHWELRVRVIE